MRCSRFTRSALLLGGSAVLAGIVAVVVTPTQVTATVPPLDALPWGTVVGAATPTLPLAILYVSERCSHCGPATRAASAAASDLGATLLVVARGRVDSTRRYAERLAVAAAVVADTSGTFGRALGVRAVPALFLFARDGQRSVVVGFRGRRGYERALGTLR